MNENVELPQKNREYHEPEFWEKRYAEGDNKVREWLGGYDLFAEHFRQQVPDKSSRILILGCGNSLLGEELYEDGYHNIVNTDISDSVIQMMAKHCDNCSKMQWIAMDCLDLQFPDESFDVVLEKATIEVFLVGEKSLWNISEDARQTVNRMASEVNRVLKSQSGQFFSISFTAPHFRKLLFDASFPAALRLGNIFSLGESFHFYMYCMSKNPDTISDQIFMYEPPKTIELSDCDLKNIEQQQQPEDSWLNGFDF